MIPERWKLVKIENLLKESRLSGTNGAIAKKITVKLYGRGVFAKKEKRLGSRNTKYFIRRKGQFIYSKLDFLNGAFGIIPDGLDNFETTLDLPCFDFLDLIDSSYFLYNVSRPVFYEAQKGFAIGGRKARRISPSEFFNLEILLPPLPEQKKIASILSSVDEAIQATQKVIGQTEKVKKGLLQELLTKGIGHTEFKKTEIGEIPVEWEVKTLGEVCNFINGRGFKPHEWRDEGLPIIRIQNLNGSTNFNYYIGEYAEKIFINPNDLLFAWSGSRGTSFGPHIWKGSCGLLNYHTWKIDITSQVHKEFLYKALQKITKEIEDNAHGASALVHMQKAYIVDYKIPFPSLSEQKQIATILSSVDKSIQQATTKKEQLLKVKKGLMQDLLTGKVRVKV